jgi:protein SCO1/2
MLAVAGMAVASAVLLAITLGAVERWADDGGTPDRGHGAAPSSPRGNAARLSDRFPNVRLRTHDDRAVDFYDDLVKDRTVVINFMYTACDTECLLTTATLDRLYDRLKPNRHRDILMLSISLDGEKDAPAALRAYAAGFGGPRPGWLYLTGDSDEIDRLRRTLGVYDLNPLIDARKESHAGILTFGNDRTDRWAALPAMMDVDGMARTIRWITRDAATRKQRMSIVRRAASSRPTSTE